MRRIVPFRVEPGHRASLHALGLDSLEACLAFTGGAMVKAAIPGRDVCRVGLAGRTYYLKRVRGEGSDDVLHECRVLHRLSQSGFPVPEPVAVGAEAGAAVLVTVGLPAIGTLERLMLEESPDAARVQRLSAKVAGLLRELHSSGINHRDFYAGHILVGPGDEVFCVDFGRAELRRHVPRRRVVKDLAALHFSLPSRVFDRAARLDFLRAYLGAEASDRTVARLAAAVQRKSRRMRAHAERKLARGEPNIHVND